MRCERWREMLSAQLDGEATRSERRDIDAHLDGCVDCRRWLDRAAALTRLARTSLVGPVPDLNDAVLAAAPRRHRRLARALRAAFGVAGVVPLILGLMRTCCPSSSRTCRW